MKVIIVLSHNYIRCCVTYVQLSSARVDVSWSRSRSIFSKSTTMTYDLYLLHVNLDCQVFIVDLISYDEHYCSRKFTRTGGLKAHQLWPKEVGLGPLAHSTSTRILERRSGLLRFVHTTDDEM